MMEPVYYRTKEGCVPVKEYFLSQYLSDKCNSKKNKNFQKIDSIIKLAAEKNGIPGGRFSSFLHGYDFQELIIEESDKHVRVLYFCYCKEKLVLLNAYYKPKLYEKARGRNVRREIEEINKKTEGYYKDFINNPNQYEIYL